MTEKVEKQKDKSYFDQIFKLFDIEQCGYISAGRLTEIAQELKQ